MKIGVILGSGVTLLITLFSVIFFATIGFGMCTGISLVLLLIEFILKIIMGVKNTKWK